MVFGVHKEGATVPVVVDEEAGVEAEGCNFCFECEECGSAVWTDEEGGGVPGWIGDAVADGPAGEVCW